MSSSFPRTFVLAPSILLAIAHASFAQSIQGRVADGITPAWNKGIQPINQENYWNAVACGKQGGARPACVFYDADICKIDDRELHIRFPGVRANRRRDARDGRPRTHGIVRDRSIHAPQVPLSTFTRRIFVWRRTVRPSFARTDAMYP